jgi:hypothetical protein
MGKGHVIGEWNIVFVRGRGSYPLMSKASRTSVGEGRVRQRGVWSTGGGANVGARSVVSVGSGRKGVKTKNTDELALMWLFEHERAIIV